MKMILYRKAFIRMTKNRLGQYVLPIVQYAMEDSRGKVHRKKWTVLQGPYGNYLFTRSQYQMVIDFYRREAADGDLLKAKGNPFLPEEIESWLSAGFDHACTLEEFQEVGNVLKGTFYDTTYTIFQEYQLQKYVRERTYDDNLDFWFSNKEFFTPKALQKSKPAAGTPKRVKEPPSVYFVLASDCEYWRSYFCKQIRSGIKKVTSSKNPAVRKFPTEAMARKYLTSNATRIKQGHYNWFPLQITTSETTT